MKLLSLAICSLGVWVTINGFLGQQMNWVSIIFGAITAILAFIAVFQIKD